MKYSEIRKKEVLDSNGEHVGDVIDCTFDISNNRLEMKHIILGGGRIEELLERIGARPDIDPVCSATDIDSISDKVYLKVNKDTLCKTIDKGVFAATDLKFTKLAKMKVVDADGFKLGNITDLWFDKASHLWLVLGGGFFEELLEKIHATPDIDLLIPQNDIERITKDSIKLTRTRFQLESTCESEYDKIKRELQGPAPHDDARYSQIRLGAGGTGLSRGMA
jgi:sporulation protein YlmC with PRC-barrel domain